MHTTSPAFSKTIYILIAIFFYWHTGCLAVEAPGSPFTLTVATNTARTYEGNIASDQWTLVAYERDVGPPALCSVNDSDYDPAEHAKRYSSSPYRAQHGNVMFKSITKIPIEDYESPGCAGQIPPNNAVAIYYQSITDYNGTDYFQYTLPSGDIITVNITVITTGDIGSIAAITPILLRTSVKQTTSIINSRIKQILIPGNHYKENSTTTPVSETGLLPQERSNSLSSQTTIKPTQQKRALSDFLNISIDHNTIGLSAGDTSMKHGIWTNIGYTSSDDDNSTTKSDMEIKSYILGYDYTLADHMAAGVALTYEAIDADLGFNNGNIDGNGYTVAPYFSMLLTKYLSMDIILGYGIIDYDQDHDGGTVDSSVDANRQFMEFSINGFHYIDQWSFNGNLSFIYAHEKQDSYTESDGTKIKSNNVDFSQLSAGLEIAYTFKVMEPYITLAFERDTQFTEINNSSYDRSGGDGGVGCRFFFSDQFSGEIYSSTKFGRANYTEYSVLGNIRYEF